MKNYVDKAHAKISNQSSSDIFSSSFQQTLLFLVHPTSRLEGAERQTLLS